MSGETIYIYTFGFLILVVLALLLYIVYLKKSVDHEVEKRVGDMESSIRRDAVERSRASIKGKLSEHMVPFTDDFGYKASDARFLGSPVDYVIFDGYSDEAEDIKVVLADVKTGRSANLTSMQRRIKKALEKGNVAWDTIEVDDI